MRILVTGATGFFGPEIVARLRSSGHEVIGASRSAKPGREMRTLDVTSTESCARVFESAGQIDAVVHAAALAHVRPDQRAAELCHQVNVRGTQNVLDAATATGVRKFVFVSSVMVYGDFDLPSLVRESDECQATGIYGVAKLRAEAACQSRSGELQVHILRMATMYSPDWLFNVRKRACVLVGGRPLYFRLDPVSRRYSLCSRRNGAEAVLWAVEDRLPPDLYNVADQYTYCQQEILDAVAATTGPGYLVHVPRTLPRMMLLATRFGVPIPQWRENARSRYWKFCERNVYSTEKLRQHGFEALPDLLSMASRN